MTVSSQTTFSSNTNKKRAMSLSEGTLNNTEHSSENSKFCHTLQAFFLRYDWISR